MLLHRLAAPTVALLALVPTLAACGSDAGELEVGAVVAAREDTR